MTGSRLNFLYTNIGRGHPFYLDGIVEELKNRGLTNDELSVNDVFGASSGVSLLAWKLARHLYTAGAAGGLASHVYRLMRSGGDYNHDTPGLRLLGRDIRKGVGRAAERIVVAHPSLVGILRDHPGLIYQHGELVAPDEALVRGAALVIVPTDEVAEKFLQIGYTDDNVFVSHLCIEPGIAAQAASCYLARQERFLRRENLTGAFFSSGAEPPNHVDLLVSAALGCTRAKGRLFIFARRNGRLHSEAIHRFGEAGIALSQSEYDSETESGTKLVTFSTREEENAQTVRYFASFDYFVAPSHERVNWAAGLGLPMFVIHPLIGPFSPLNAELTARSGVAASIRDVREADDFHNELQQRLHAGELARMAAAGWGRYNFDGFARIAELLISKRPPKGDS